MRSLPKIISLLIIVTLFTACARTFAGADGVTNVAAAVRSETAEEMAGRMAQEHCTRYGHRGYELVSLSSSAAPSPYSGQSCGVVRIKCHTKGTCLEYQCSKNGTERTAKLAFVCK